MSFSKFALSFTLGTLLVLAASGIVLFLVDGNLAAGWSNNVVRNWEQFGLGPLNSKLVQNPGGFEALTKPEFERGHRAASLYPVLFVRRVFSWTGAGTFCFNLALNLTVLVSTWMLLGRSRVSWLVASAAILCPGYEIYQTTLDPNAIVVLLGLPFAAIVLRAFRKPSLSPSARVILLIVMGIYTSLNWTTIFVHGMLLAYLLTAQAIRRRDVAVYVVFAGLSLGAVAAMSILDKLKGGLSLKEMVSAYMWGSTGYGTDLTTGKALQRLFFSNAAGLLPLLLVCVYLLAKLREAEARHPWVFLGPLCVTVVGILAMRNYFGHHPWMSTPVMLTAIILSLGGLLRECDASGPERKQVEPTLWGLGTFLAGSLVYASVVAVMYQLQNAESTSFLRMVRNNTARSDTVVLVTQTVSPIHQKVVDRRICRPQG